MKKKIKKIRKFFYKHQVLQITLKMISDLTGVPYAKLSFIIKHLEAHGYIFIERNHGKSNRYHYRY